MAKRIFIIACLIMAAYVLGDLVKTWNTPTPVKIVDKKVEISKDCWK